MRFKTLHLLHAVKHPGRAEIKPIFDDADCVIEMDRGMVTVTARNTGNQIVFPWNGMVKYGLPLEDAVEAKKRAEAIKAADSKAKSR